MIEYLVLDMFKFNFNIDDNNSNDNLNIQEEEEENCLSNQEFGYFNIDDSQNISKDDRQKFELHKSDLVPNIYEGKLARFCFRRI
jgi:hypothetical protein